MEAIFAYFLIKFIDPISLITVGTILFLAYGKKWAKPVAIIGAAVFIETVLTSSQSTRTWGDGIIFAIIVHSVQAWVCDFFIKKYKRNQANITINMTDEDIKTWNELLEKNRK